MSYLVVSVLPSSNASIHDAKNKINPALFADAVEVEEVAGRTRPELL